MAVTVVGPQGAFLPFNYKPRVVQGFPPCLRSGAVSATHPPVCLPGPRQDEPSARPAGGELAGQWPREMRIASAQKPAARATLSSALCPQTPEPAVLSRSRGDEAGPPCDSPRPAASARPVPFGGCHWNTRSLPLTDSFRAFLVLHRLCMVSKPLPALPHAPVHKHGPRTYCVQDAVPGAGDTRLGSTRSLPTVAVLRPDICVDGWPQPLFLGSGPLGSPSCKLQVRHSSSWQENFQEPLVPSALFISGRNAPILSHGRVPVPADRRLYRHFSGPPLCPLLDGGGGWVGRCEGDRLGPEGVGFLKEQIWREVAFSHLMFLLR